MIADVDQRPGIGKKDISPGEELLSKLRLGGMRSLARAISTVEDAAPDAAGLIRLCRATGRRALRIGVTGPPGAGKSTLVDGLIRRFRQQNKTVGVIAVDPSSPYSGGALLGDRIRMAGFAGDDGVYIRSMATRGGRGGLAVAAADVCSVMEAAGRDIVLIETVGAGQSDVEVAGLVDVAVVVLVPGMGDEVQSMKAGMMEIADIYVVNKSDCADAQQVEVELIAMQRLNEGSAAIPIVKTVATAGEGIEDVHEAIESVGSAKRKQGNRAVMSRVTPWHVADPQRVQLDHLGIAVRSIAEAQKFYEALGLAVVAEETVEHEQVKTAMLPLSDSRLELLQPMSDDSAIGRFLARRGEGLHHIAVRVSDIDAVFARMQANDVRLASTSIQFGAGGHRYFFIHPDSAAGVLVEIVGDPPEDPNTMSERVPL